MSFLHFCDTTNGAVLDFVIAIHTINLSIAKPFSYEGHQNEHQVTVCHCQVMLTYEHMCLLVICPVGSLKC